MSPLREGAEVSGGFLLLTAWFALVNGWRLLAVILSAALLHETGHLLALYLLGGRAAGVRITVFGAELRTDAAHLSYPAELAVTLAGPAANLACGLLLARLGAWTAAGAHLSLCAFNCCRCVLWTAGMRWSFWSPGWRDGGGGAHRPPHRSCCGRWPCVWARSG